MENKEKLFLFLNLIFFVFIFIFVALIFNSENLPKKERKEENIDIKLAEYTEKEKEQKIYVEKKSDKLIKEINEDRVKRNNERKQEIEKEGVNMCWSYLINNATYPRYMKYIDGGVDNITETESTIFVKYKTKNIENRIVYPEAFCTFNVNNQLLYIQYK